MEDPIVGASMGRPFRWPRWGVATQSSILILIITGCSAAPAETIVPDPSATHFPSESPIASQTTGGTAEVLDCVVADYPCTWAEVPEGVLVRSRELALSAHGQHSSGGSYLTSGEWLREQEGVAEVLADESGVRFRLERGRPVWLLDRPDVGSDVSGLAYVMARRVAPPRGSRPGRVVDSRQERGREARSGFDAVVGNEEPEKHATVLAPFAWHPGMDASSIAELLDGTRGYEGGVSYLANWAPDESTVSFASFADLPGEDVVYIKSYGGQVCPDGEACHATIAVQELDDADFHLDDAEAAILDIIVWPDGSESLSVEADFFR